MKLVVVESPAKAKTINKYLGDDYVVVASYGHVRDLPSKDGSVLPDEDFAMIWEVDADARKRTREITKVARRADAIYLATDPDREGEAISWHVHEILKRDKAVAKLPVRRVVFNEITKHAVLEAMANPRALDEGLIDAYLARRALDYLVGFTLSPVLWRKLPGARSAGRVQSVALRLVADREYEIEAFDSREYWTVEAEFRTARGDRLSARLVELKGEKLDKFTLSDKAAAARAEAAIEDRDFRVAMVESKPARRHPQPPFTTATLQQEAARKLGFSASHTMRVAQKLYEGVAIGGEVTGLITYMRTDGVQIAREAVSASRAVIEKDFGGRYLPSAPRQYKTKAKNAQEAHEAIRPTAPGRRPGGIRGALENDQQKLYELIWNRAIASQMASAEFERTTVDVQSRDREVGLRAIGTVITFDGFLKLYRESRDNARDGGDDARLPKVTRDEDLERLNVVAAQHFTEPPPRYSEASLVKKLEELGIGRPSTYASILDVLRTRNYVRMEKKRFVPEDKGRLVTAFLESFFARYVEYDFTARLEERLDEISAGKVAWKTVLAAFWKDFSAAVGETRDLKVSEVLDALNNLLGRHVFGPGGADGEGRSCPDCGDGKLSLKLGKYGAFVGCSNYPDCRHTRQLSSSADNGGKAGENGPRVLGQDPDSGLDVTLRSGRFGPYVQLGEGKGKDKPKRASLPKDLMPGNVDLEKALALLSLPRQLGNHPETGKPIIASIGRYGPYLGHDGAYASLANSDEVFTTGLNRAVTLLAEAATKSRGRQRPEALRVVGDHPGDGEPVILMTGRYGPYVTHGKLNATIPKGRDLDGVTLEEALELLASRAKRKAQGKGKSKRRKAS